MEQIFSKLEFITNGEGFIDITNDLNLFIKKNNFDSGILNLTSLHTSCSLTINENADPNVLRDLKKYMQSIVPYDSYLTLSKNKEEPRLANRFEENGADLEQPLAIARDIKKLYERLLPLKDNLKINQFLIDNSDLRHVVRRAFIIEKFPYSEIQDNTIGENLVPIDMLRLKLSFFGALKFDPRSDKWLRICMFQGAPLPNELKDYDEQWVYKTHS